MKKYKLHFTMYELVQFPKIIDFNLKVFRHTHAKLSFSVANNFENTGLKSNIKRMIIK